MDDTAIAEPKQTSLAVLAGEINDLHRQAEDAASSALEHAHAAGELLRQAKLQCPHGEWVKWLKANFSGSKRTAQIYMQIADPYNWERIQKRNGVAHVQVNETRLFGVKGAVKLLAKPSPKKPASAVKTMSASVSTEEQSQYGFPAQDIAKAEAIRKSGNQEVNDAVWNGKMNLDEALEQIGHTDADDDTELVEVWVCETCGGTEWDEAGCCAVCGPDDGGEKPSCARPAAKVPKNAELPAVEWDREVGFALEYLGEAEVLLEESADALRAMDLPQEASAIEGMGKQIDAIRDEILLARKGVLDEEGAS